MRGALPVLVDDAGAHAVAGRAGGSPRAVARSWFRTLALLSLLLLGWRALVVQAHVHPLAPRTVRGVGHAPRGFAAEALATDGDDCALCQQLAIDGDLLPGVPPAFALLVAGPVPRVVVHLSSARARPRSHDWRSRAPPGGFPRLMS